jgi:hypothetical protein
MCLALYHGRLACEAPEGRRVVIVKVFNKLADRLLALLVPTATAQAEPCACGHVGTITYEYCTCINNTLKYRRVWCDGCNIHRDTCKTVDFC